MSTTAIFGLLTALESGGLATKVCGKGIVVDDDGFGSKLLYCVFDFYKGFSFSSGSSSS